MTANTVVNQKVFHFFKVIAHYEGVGINHTQLLITRAQEAEEGDTETCWLGRPEPPLAPGLGHP